MYESIPSIYKVNYDVVISISYENKLELRKKKSYLFDDHLTTKHDPDVYTVRPLGVYRSTLDN